jgi:hypothetical protein
MSNPNDKSGKSGESTESNDDVYAPGEGNRAADRRYREATEKFVAEGRVQPAADEARRAMDDEDERKELERAEQVGRSRAKEHDPEVERR